MDTVKKFLFVIILLAVIVLVWVGSTFILPKRDNSISETTKSYTTQIPKSFNLEELDKVYERTEKSFPISPKEFINLVEKED